MRPLGLLATVLTAVPVIGLSAVTAYIQGSHGAAPSPLRWGVLVGAWLVAAYLGHKRATWVRRCNAQVEPGPGPRDLSGLAGAAGAVGAVGVLSATQFWTGVPWVVTFAWLILAVLGGALVSNAVALAGRERVRAGGTGRLPSVDE